MSLSFIKPSPKPKASGKLRLDHSKFTQMNPLERWFLMVLSVNEREFDRHRKWRNAIRRVQLIKGLGAEQGRCQQCGMSLKFLVACFFLEESVSYPRLPGSSYHAIDP
jgi:hypothetical protein